MNYQPVNDDCCYLPIGDVPESPNYSPPDFESDFGINDECVCPNCKRTESVKRCRKCGADFVDEKPTMATRFFAESGYAPFRFYGNTAFEGRC
ncbi:MAG: hypothetical protein ACPGXK_00050 [Phycisphaerae bacterium]